MSKKSFKYITSITSLIDTCIKNVDEITWKKFKVEAVKHEMSMGEFLGRLVDEHEQSENSAKESWERILKGKPLLTEKEAEEIKKEMKELRKGFEFRDVI